MADPPETIQVPIGSYRALGWFFEASQDAFLVLQGENVVRVNPAWTAISGFEAAASEGDSFWRFVSPDDLARVEPQVRALKLGAQFECELRVRTAGGADVWTRATFVGGEAPWMLAILRDITFQRRVRESEARFRGLVNATSDVVYRMSPDWREMRALDGRGFLADTETPSVAWIEQYLLPEDRPHILATIDEAIAGKSVFQLEHRVRQADGSIGWTFSRAVPMLDEAGEVIEWFGCASDVTERHRAEAHLRLMIDELNHRVKNNLAMMQAATWQAFRHAGDLVEAGESLTARIAALAHASDLLTGDARVGLSVRGVVEEALRPHCDDPSRCVIEGPPVGLSPRQAHTLSLAMHELATNAIKHGAWSSDLGQVAVTWSSAPADQRLRLEWRERGGPPVTPPARRGFGSRLIERALASEFGGGAQLSFDRDGLVCVVDARLAA